MEELSQACLVLRIDILAYRGLQTKETGWGSGVRKGAEAISKTALYHQDGQLQDVSSVGLGQDYFTEHLLIGGLTQSSSSGPDHD